MKKRLFVLMLVGLCLSAQFAYAHAVWVEVAGEDYVFKYGEGELGKTESYENNKLKKVVVYNEQGNKVVFKKKSTKKGVVISSDQKASLVLTEFDNGYWVNKGNDDWVEVGLSQIKPTDQSDHSVKYGKSFFGKSQLFQKKQGLMLEIVPLKSYEETKKSKVFEGKVLYNKKILAKAEVVTNNSSKTFKTDKFGIFKINLKKNDLYYFEASHNQLTHDPKDAKNLYITSTLTFY